MNVVFIEPPAALAAQNQGRVPERLYGCSYELYHFPDLANLYCVAVLEKAGFNVRIVDAILEGLSEKAFFERLSTLQGQVLVLHSVLLSKPTDLAVMDKVLADFPDTRIVVHGPEPTRVPEQFLIDERVVVIRGEPENALADLLLEKQAHGISQIKNGKITHTPAGSELVNIDDLPFPARDHPDIRPFRDKLYNPKFEHGPSAMMMASRGCSFGCLFCVPNSISFAREIETLRETDKKPRVAKASADRVIAEFRAIAKQGYRSLSIIDDQFLWDKQRTLDICAGVKDLGLEWGILSRADFLDDPEVVCALREAGCTSVDIGVESLNQKTLDYVNKNLRVAQVETAVKTCKACGVEPKFNILFGASPTETPNEIRETVRNLRNIGVERVMFSIATPFKGTRFYDICETEGYLVDKSDAIDPMTKSMISYPAPGMNKSTLESETKKAYRDFYFHPKTLWRKLISIRSFEELKNNIKIARRLF